MRLVAVAEIRGELRPVHRRVRLGAFQCLVDAVAQDDPLGADAHVGGEQTLQGAHRQSLGAGQFVDAADRAVGAHQVDQGHGLFGLGVRLRAERQQIRVERRDPRVLLPGVQHGRRRGGRREHLGCRDPAPRPLRHGPAGCERPEAARPELHTADPPPPLQLLCEELQPDARDLREPGVLVAAARVPLEDQVDAGVRDQMGGVRVTQVPVDQPVVLQVGAQRGGGFAAPEAHVREQLGGVDDAPGVASGTSGAGHGCRSYDAVASVSHVSRFFKTRVVAGCRVEA